MNKEICWSLTIKTSLPNVAKCLDDFKTRTVCFKNFEDAKKALREKLHEFAFSKNSMFDGNGNLIMLNDFMLEMYEDEKLITDDSFLCPTKLKVLEENLLHIFKGQDVPL